MDLEQRIAELEKEIRQIKNGVYRYSQRDEYTKAIKTPMLIASGDGLKIGGSTTEKVGFFGVAPTDQFAHITDPSGGGTSELDAIDLSAREKIGSILDLLEEKGLMAS